MDCTVDTQIIGNSAQGDGDSFEILNRIKRTRKVIFDDENMILTEYQRCIDRARDKGIPGWKLMQEWLEQVISQGARTVNCHLTRNQITELHELHFHDDDWKFVKACKSSLSKTLVANESDYSESIKDYLKTKYQIDVFNIEYCIQNDLFLN